MSFLGHFRTHCNSLSLPIVQILFQTADTDGNWHAGTFGVEHVLIFV